jgi:hypothetical protein
MLILKSNYLIVRISTVLTRRNMSQRIVAICLLVVFAFFAGVAMSYGNKGTQPAAQESTAPVKASPAEGYNVHVLTPTLVDCKQMGPYHHYCKMIAPDPQIQCLI